MARGGGATTGGGASYGCGAALADELRVSAACRRGPPVRSSSAGAAPGSRRASALPRGGAELVGLGVGLGVAAGSSPAGESVGVGDGRGELGSHSSPPVGVGVAESVGLGRESDWLGVGDPLCVAHGVGDPVPVGDRSGAGASAVDSARPCARSAVPSAGSPSGVGHAVEVLVGLGVGDGLCDCSGHGSPGVGLDGSGERAVGDAVLGVPSLGVGLAVLGLAVLEELSLGVGVAVLGGLSLGVGNPVVGVSPVGVGEPLGDVLGLADLVGRLGLGSAASLSVGDGRVGDGRDGEGSSLGRDGFPSDGGFPPAGRWPAC